MDKEDMDQSLVSSGSSVIIDLRKRGYCLVGALFLRRINYL